MLQAERNKNDALNDLARRMFEKFSKEHDVWKTVVELTATLDVLTSLAIYANNQSQICFPEILDIENGKVPILQLDDGYHPCVRSADDFIPNGITLGGSEGVAPLVLLTGPNMGGKSTLMRQIGLLIIMAQMVGHIISFEHRLCMYLFAILFRVHQYRPQVVAYR